MNDVKRTANRSRRLSWLKLACPEAGAFLTRGSACASCLWQQYPHRAALFHLARQFARSGTEAPEDIGAHRIADGATSILGHHQTLQRRF